MAIQWNPSITIPLTGYHEDTSWPKGVRNRGVPLYIIESDTLYY
jgi:hypothetical protein